MKRQVNATKAEESRMTDERVELSSANVFADLGFPDAEGRLLKAKLAVKNSSTNRRERVDPSPGCRADGFESAQSIASPTGTAFRLFSGTFVCNPQPSRS
jgi:hypothetical protein